MVSQGQYGDEYERCECGHIRLAHEWFFEAGQRVRVGGCLAVLPKDRKHRRPGRRCRCEAFVGLTKTPVSR